MIHYINYFKHRFIKNRASSPAAQPKIAYVFSALKRTGQAAIIVSACPAQPGSGHLKKQLIEDVLYFPSIGLQSRINYIANRQFMRIRLFQYLITHVKKEDTVVAYHSLYYMTVVGLARKIRGFKLIIEVNEMYSDVTSDKKTEEKEMIFFRLADAYILSTHLLNERINKFARPYAINHGSYLSETRLTPKLSDGRVHCVYAGTFDIKKGGAFAAVKAAGFLDEKYHLHVIGFGNSEQIEEIKKAIHSVSLKTKCAVTYDGMKEGDDYLRFLQSCDIGLSTQDPEAAFNRSSFPSKVLSYLCNGLKVVSIRIPAIELSAVGEHLFFYDTQTPESIAQAIQVAAVTESEDATLLMKKLDDEFCEKIKCMVQ